MSASENAAAPKRPCADHVTTTSQQEGHFDPKKTGGFSSSDGRQAAGSTLEGGYHFVVSFLPYKRTYITYLAFMCRKAQRKILLHITGPPTFVEHRVMTSSTEQTNSFHQEWSLLACVLADFKKQIFG